MLHGEMPALAKSIFRIVQLPDGNRGAALSFFQHNPLAVIWFFFGLFWMLPGIFGKRTIQKQTSRSRFLQLALLVGTYVLMAVPDLGWGLLNQSVVPTGRTASAVGYGLLLGGMSFAGWARIFLGGNWSSNVTLKKDHTLVRTGPYRIVRHPIYTGLLVALLGTAVALGPLRCFLGVILAAVAWKIKSITEELFMVQQFGDQYTRYRMQVKALVPYIW
jgi:protein-S-isoprenylcysteine O-methyltransferase Ste14